jgi:hypothetical protein
MIKHPKEGCVYLMKDGRQKGFWYGMCVKLPEYDKKSYIQFATFRVLGKKDKTRGWLRYDRHQSTDQNRYWNIIFGDSDGTIEKKLKYDEIPDEIWLEMI